MRLRHVNRTATLAWSPGQHDAGPLLAAGTVAGALDASFSTSAELEIFDLNLSSKPGVAGHNKLRPVGKVTCTARFNRLAWGTIPGDVSKPLGMLASGMENGDLDLWNPAAIIEGNPKSLLMRKSIHGGPVRGLDFNILQGNLLASGATDGQIYVWDLTNPTSPYTPGAKSQRLEDVTVLQWNRQVPYILATASNNGNTVLWDLRHKREIASLSHPGGRKPITAIAWNPSTPTQLVTASDDDNAPSLLVWDLRNAAAPQMVDNSTLAWNPNTGEMIGELAHSNNWSFDVQWCPRNPDLVAVSSFDGFVSVHSLQSSDGDADEIPPTPVQHSHTTDDPFAPHNINPTQPHVSTKFALRQPPKWLRRPVGASFGFGGKLLTFDSDSRRVSVRTVPTEHAFAKRVDELEAVMADDQLESYKRFCEHRASATDEGNAVNETDRELWKFIKVMLETSAREQVVEYLGLRTSSQSTRLDSLLQQLRLAAHTKPVELFETPAKAAPAPPIGGTDSQANGLGNLFGASQVEFPDMSAMTEHTAQEASLPRRKPDPFSLYPAKPGQDSDVDIIITKAVVLGDFETAVDAALGANRLADALMLAVSGGTELLVRTQQEYFRRQKEKSYIRVLQSVVKGDLLPVVEDAALDGREGGWKDILALVCTYGKAEDSAELFTALGKRLEAAGDSAPVSRGGPPSENKKFAAALCYVAAGDLKKVVSIWSKRETEEERSLLQGAGASSKKDVTAHMSHTVALQSLIEKVTVFRKAIGFADPELSNPSGFFELEGLYDHYAEYAESVASQGKLDMAWTMLELVPESFRWTTKQEGAHGPPPGTEDAIAVLRNRVYQSGGVRRQAQQPAFPYALKDLTEGHLQTAPYAQPAQVTQTAYPGAASNGYTSSYYNQAAPAQAGVWGQPAQPAYNAQQGYQNFAPAAPQPSYVSPPQSTAAAPYQPPYQAPYQAPQYGGYDQQQTSGYAQPLYGGQTSGYSALPPPPSDSHASFLSTQNTAPPTNWNDPPALTHQARLASKPTPAAPPLAQGPTIGAHPTQAPWQQPEAARAPTPLAPPPTAGFATSAFGASPISPPSQPNGQFQQYGQQPGGQSASQYPAQATSGYGQPQQQTQAHTVTRSTAQEPPKPTPPVPAAPKFPPGDRSQIPAAHKPLFDGLQKYLAVLKAASSAPQQKRVYEDAEKKISILYDQLNAQEVPADVVAKMLELVKALDAKDYQTATSIQIDLVTTRYDVTGKWMLVVKRLIDSAERANAPQMPVQQQQQQQQQGGYAPLPPQGYGHPPPPPMQHQGMPPPPTQGMMAPPPQQLQYQQQQMQQQRPPPPPMGQGPPPMGQGYYGR
ncbi:protein transport protein S31 [Thoreauomyces humboldtii]|nr:protein transport protein S31 [Thoreauomyces humboldtii]